MIAANGASPLHRNRRPFDRGCYGRTDWGRDECWSVIGRRHLSDVLKDGSLGFFLAEFA
jgi:hypothetical protein